MKNNNQDLIIPIEDEQHCAAIIEHSRHAGSIPVARSPSENGESVEKSVEKSDEIATESGHWYLPDGTPFYTTERRSGPQKGEKRAVSLRHDRKLLMQLKAVPSVTTITRLLDKPALNAYRERHVFLATLDLLASGVSPGVALSELNEADALKAVQSKSQEHRAAAAERGTSLHTAIEKFLQGKSETSSPWMPHVFAVVNALAQYGVTLRGGCGVPEHSFAYDCGVGCYGGKVDFHERDFADDENMPNPDGLVVDFKSKDEITDEQLAGKEKLVYDEHAMQLASYREGLLLPNARCINVFVGEQDRRVFIYEHRNSDLKRGWELFKALLQVWKIKNNYYVRI